MHQAEAAGTNRLTRAKSPLRPASKDKKTLGFICTINIRLFAVNKCVKANY